jgi:hypothetical protein
MWSATPSSGGGGVAQVSASQTATYVLSSSSPILTVDPGVSVDTRSTSGDAVDGYSGATWSVIGVSGIYLDGSTTDSVDNHRQISGGVGGFSAGGAMINEAGATVSAQSTAGAGLAAFYFAQTGGTLINYGSVIGANYGAYFDSDETGDSMTDGAGGLLQGGADEFAPVAVGVEPKRPLCH